MEENRFNGRISPSTTATSTAQPVQPNYGSRAVREALEHLASVDLIELCSEAKVERCRATRDLRSCGRQVHYVLNSCGHASLCSECSQRCDLCPICRIPIPKSGDRLRLRLYYECIKAGLLSKRCDERFQEKDDGSNQLTADVERLYSLFDVALENNLVSLICHYVTDVCMDEAAVSSDPVFAFLLDEVVVKDWCKRTFKNIIAELQGIYGLEAEEMRTKLNLLLKFSGHLAGVSNVLDVLESSFKGSLSAQLQDLQLLKENISKTKQHAELMMWCIRHQFLENVRSFHIDIMSWRTVFQGRKSDAIKRSWPDVVNQFTESSLTAGSLFIEDALANLETEQGHVQERGGESELSCLQKDKGSLFLSNIQGLAGCYPFESVRAAVDVLFLHGSSDSVVAKQAIFLYYLFDRHWKMPDESWKDLIDDFAATFGITRHSLIESRTFLLLDDNTDEALKEACDLLPEISGQSTHPKISQVLLERGVPEIALMVLRWSGRDGSEAISLGEAVTAVRVRVECGLLTEAFMHQRMLCTRVAKKKMKAGLQGEASNDLKDECRTWKDWMDALVTEICCLCTKRNLVDRMIELPWNLDEEKYIHRCLLDCAIHDPSTTSGSLLVVFYLQRYRYAEAYQVDQELQAVEQNFISKNSSTLSEEVLSRMRSASQWRAGLVVKSIELLPPPQQQQVKAGMLNEKGSLSVEEVNVSEKSDLLMAQEPKLGGLLVSQAGGSSVVPQEKHSTPFKSLVFGTPTKFGGSIRHPISELGNYGSPLAIHEKLLANAERGVSIKNFKSDIARTPRTNRVFPVNATPSKDIGRTPVEVLPNTDEYHAKYDKISPGTEQNGFAKEFQRASPYIQKVANQVSVAGGNRGFSNDSAQVQSANVSSKRVHSQYRDDVFWDVTSGDDQMDTSWRDREKSYVVDENQANGALRWRSDETSDEEETNSPYRDVGVVSYATPSRGNRRRRFSRR